MRERRYASSGDYSVHTGAPAPEDLDRRVFVRASRRVDRALVGAIYPTDEHGMPVHQPECGQSGCVLTCPVVALRDAVCAQVAWWRARGDKDGTGIPSHWNEVKIGDVSLRRNDSGTAAAGVGADGLLAPEAGDILTDAELYPVFPWISG